MDGQVDMAALGLTEEYRAMAAQSPGCRVGRVVSQERGAYRVCHDRGEQAAVVSGRFSYEARSGADYPAVGDFVLLEAADADSPAVIRAVLPRKSVFIRKAAGTAGGGQVVAANADVLFLSMALGNDFSVRRLERYLSIAWESGAAPVVVLTKADLCGCVAEKRAEAAAAAVGAAVLTVSALEEDGCRALLAYLGPGRTAALLGSSGVGKSSLINRLLGGPCVKTGGLRRDEKGRHTTTRRQLYLLPSGGVIMDTPGMRELGMWDAAEGVERTFSDIEALARRCRFRDCTHRTEPGCAVRAAIRDGTLSEARWRSYQKLTAENAFAEDAQSHLAEKTRRFKEIAKRNKGNRKA